MNGTTGWRNAPAGMIDESAGRMNRAEDIFFFFFIFFFSFFFFLAQAVSFFHFPLRMDILFPANSKVP